MRQGIWLCKGIEHLLNIPADGAAIAVAVALRDRLEAKIAEAVSAFDAAGLWDLDAATSMTAWLRAQAYMTRREAAHVAARAKALRNLPVTARAWASGELSAGQVDALLAGVKAKHRQRFAEHEAEVVPALVGLSVNDTARALAHWSTHAEGLEDEVEPTEPERALHLSSTLDGTWILDGTPDPLSGEVVSTALRLAETPDSEAEPARNPSTRRADALTDVCRFYLDHQHHCPESRHRPHVNVVVDYEDLTGGGAGRVVDGAELDRASTQALVCDSVLHRLVMAGASTVLDYGTATRVISPGVVERTRAARRALPLPGL